MSTEFAVEVPAVAAPAPRAASNARLAGGFIGRTWLWFIGGCLVVTLLPLLFGWRPYVVESGSMAPRIKVGDVILAAPEKDPKKLLGHVTVFHDPDAARAGTIKSHRVVTINPDGTMTTKGDANPTVDSVHLQVSQVIGLGRLLVRWVGLPLIWVQKGAWVQLGMFAASLWIGALLVMRDVDPEPDPDTTDPDGTDGTDTDPDGTDTDDTDTDGTDPDGADAGHDEQPQSRRRRFARRAAHAKPAPGIGASARAFGRRAATVLAGSLALLLPTSQAAMSATTKNNTDTWSVPNYNYTTETNNLGPYLYWKLDDAAASTTAIDTSGNGRTGTYNSTWTKQIVGPLVDQAANLAVTATNAGAAGTNVSCVYTTSNAGIAATGPTVYSEIIWFKTVSTTGGKLIGYENTRTGVSDSGAGGQYDRMLYMDGAGKVWFAVWKTVAAVGLAISSPTALNDGNWHMAAATMSTTTGYGPVHRRRAGRDQRQHDLGDREQGRLLAGRLRKPVRLEHVLDRPERTGRADELPLQWVHGRGHRVFHHVDAVAGGVPVLDSLTPFHRILACEAAYSTPGVAFGTACGVSIHRGRSSPYGAPGRPDCAVGYFGTSIGRTSMRAVKKFTFSAEQARKNQPTKEYICLRSPSAGTVPSVQSPRLSDCWPPAFSCGRAATQPSPPRRRTTATRGPRPPCR